MGYEKSIGFQSEGVVVNMVSVLVQTLKTRAPIPPYSRCGNFPLDDASFFDSGAGASLRTRFIDSFSVIGNHRKSPSTTSKITAGTHLLTVVSWRKDKSMCSSDIVVDVVSRD